MNERANQLEAESDVHADYLEAASQIDPEVRDKIMREMEAEGFFEDDAAVVDLFMALSVRGSW